MLLSSTKYRRLSLLFVIITVLFPILFLSSPSHAAASIPQICGTLNAKSIMEEYERHKQTANTGDKEDKNNQDLANIYNKTKWLVSCSMAFGISGLDEAAVYVKKMATNASTGGLDKNAVSYAALAESMENLSKNPVLGTSIFERTQKIGLWLLIICFMIGLAMKCYMMFVGTEDQDPTDFILGFVRFVTLMSLLLFLRPLAFYGMTISSVIADLLISEPVNTVMLSGSTYNPYNDPTSTMYTPGTDDDMSGVQGRDSFSPWTNDQRRVTGEFMEKRNKKNGGVRYHKGIDYTTGGRSIPLYAPVSGVAECHGTATAPSGFMMTITQVIPGQGADGKAKNTSIQHIMMHLASCPAEYTGSGAKVTKGQKVAMSGNSGMAGGDGYPYHLHMETRIGGQSMNPVQVYNQIQAGNPVSLASTGNAGASGSVTGGGANVGQASSNATGVERSGRDAVTLSGLFYDLCKMKQMYTDSVDENFTLTGAIKGLIPIFGNNFTWTHWLSFIAGKIALWLAGAAMTVIIILADVMMGITIVLGPIVIALSFIPLFENYLSNWIKGYVTFLFYMPLASMFQILAFAMFAVTLDSGWAAFMILVICYVGGCMKIPNIADGLSTTALMGMATMMAMAPAMLTMKAASMGLSMGLNAVAPGAGTAVGAAADSAAGAVSSSVSSGSGGGDSGGGGNSGGGGHSSGASIPKISNQGGGKQGGWIKPFKLVLPVILIIMAIICITGSVASAANNYTLSQEEKKEILNITTDRVYPDPKLADSVIQAAKDKNSGVYAFMPRFLANAVYSIMTTDDSNPLKGIYNTSYRDAVDLPMTKFVLGHATVDADQMYDIAFASRNDGKRMREASAASLAKFAIEYNMLSTVGDIGLLNIMSNNTGPAISAITAKTKSINSLLSAAQDSIKENFMLKIPLYVLFLMIFMQAATIGYLKICNFKHIGEQINFVSLVPRILIYIALILFFRSAVTSLITISNYISNAIVPLETQYVLMQNITSKTSLVISGTGLNSTGNAFFRWLTYAAMKIMLISRDMFMAITIIVGPMCIALGFHTNYGSSDDVIHKFFTGWIESFVQLLMWGPIASIMLYALGILSVLTALDALSFFSVAITGMAFLYAAGNIPDLARRMSSVAMLAMLTAMAPVMASIGRLGFGGAVMFGKMAYGRIGANTMVMGGMMGGMLGGIANKLSGIVHSGGSRTGGGGGGGGGNMPSDGHKVVSASSTAPNIADIGNAQRQAAQNNKNGVLSGLQDPAGLLNNSGAGVAAGIAGTAGVAGAAAGLAGMGKAGAMGAAAGLAGIAGGTGVDNVMGANGMNPSGDMKTTPVSSFASVLTAPNGVKRFKYSQQNSINSGALNSLKMSEMGEVCLSSWCDTAQMGDTIGHGELDLSSLVSGIYGHEKIIKNAGLEVMSDNAKYASSARVGLQAAKSFIENNKTRMSINDYNNASESISDAYNMIASGTNDNGEPISMYEMQSAVNQASITTNAAAGNSSDKILSMRSAMGDALSGASSGVGSIYNKCYGIDSGFNGGVGYNQMDSQMQSCTRSMYAMDNAWNSLEQLHSDGHVSDSDYQQLQGAILSNTSIIDNVASNYVMGKPMDGYGSASDFESSLRDLNAPVVNSIDQMVYNAYGDVSGPAFVQNNDVSDSYGTSGGGFDSPSFSPDISYGESGSAGVSSFAPSDKGLLSGGMPNISLKENFWRAFEKNFGNMQSSLSSTVAKDNGETMIKDDPSTRRSSERAGD